MELQSAHHAQTGRLQPEPPPHLHDQHPPTAKPHRWICIPTGLSLLRLALAAAFPFATRPIAVSLVLAAAISDGLDGWLARRWRLTTAWGSVLDGLTDKIFLWTALGTLVARGMLPTWALMLLLIRDFVVIPTVFITALTQTRNILMHEMDHPLTSRLATLAIFAVIIAQTAWPHATALHGLLIGTAGVLSVAAAISYLARLRHLAGRNIDREPGPRILKS